MGARRDLERRLHDGAALRISALTLRLGLLRHRRPDDEHDFRVAVEELQDELHLVLQELRDIAGGSTRRCSTRPGSVPRCGRPPARGAVPVRIDAPDERFGPDVEGAAYFAVLGCLPGSPPDLGGVWPTVRAHPDRLCTRSADRLVIRRDGDTLVLLVTGVDACQADVVHDACACWAARSLWTPRRSERPGRGPRSL